MSYARWGWEGSDVYVFGTDVVETDNGGRVGGMLVCMHGGDDEGVSFTCKTSAEMIAHLLEHRERGDTVPESAIERLREEMPK